MKTRFYICRHCGNLIGMVHDSGVPVVCCGEKMEPLVPNTVDAAGEKHLPVVTVEGSTLLWDELRAFQGLDEKDLQNFVMVAQYLEAQERMNRTGGSPLT